MKTKTLSIIVLAFLLVSLYSKAQVKIYNGGNVSIGSSSAPPSGFKMQLIGNSVYSANTGSIISSAYIRGLNSFSSATNPDFTWWGNDQTGIFHPASDNFGITVGGIEKIRVQNNIVYFPFNGSQSIQSSPLIRYSNSFSSSTSPDFTWWGNDQTGMYHPQGNNIAFSIGGSEAMRIQSDASISIGRNYSNKSMLYVYSNRNGDGTPSNSSSPIYSETNQTVDYGWNIVARVNRTTTKSFIVDYNGTHNFYVYGDGYIMARNLLVNSDERLKKDITDIDDVSKVFLLKPKSYNFKKQSEMTGFKGDITDTITRPKQYGFIAQDVQKVYPELVYSDEKGTLSINYIALIPMIIKALKQQNQTIFNQQEQITTLQQIVVSQNSDILCLKNKLSVDCDTQKSLKSGKLAVADPSNANLPATAAILYQNTPNPFSAQTEIKFDIPKEIANAILYIHDMSGNEMRSFNIAQRGLSSIIIQGSELQAGMYLYTLIVNGQIADTKKMILTK
jgi:hypothetical protein